MGLKAFRILFALLTVVIFFGFNNCPKVKLQTDPVVVTSNASADERPYGKIIPGFAIRGIECLSCHGHVKGNLFTDFGYGDPFYFGKNVDQWTGTAYRPDNLANLLVEGDIYVPKRVLPYVSNTSNIKSTFLNTARTKSPSIFAKYNGTPNRNYIELKDFVEVMNPRLSSVPLSGTPRGHTGDIFSRDVIQITAPSSQAIKEAISLPTTELLAKTEYKNVFLYRASKLDKIEGLILKSNDYNFEGYARNSFNPDEPLKCYGDFMVDGPIFLNNATIETDIKGCRLYSTGTIFVQGPIKYSGPSKDEANLQLSSARAILMGMKSISRAYKNANTSGLHNFQTSSEEARLVSEIADDVRKIDSQFLDPNKSQDLALNEDAGPYTVVRSGKYKWRGDGVVRGDTSRQGNPFLGFYGDPSNITPTNVYAWLSMWTWMPTSVGPYPDNLGPIVGYLESLDDSTTYKWKPSIVAPEPIRNLEQDPHRDRLQFVLVNSNPPSASQGDYGLLNSPDLGYEDWAKGIAYSNFLNDWTNGALKRKTVEYERVLLNAPKVWSRYYGSFKGMIIAEQVAMGCQDPQDQGQAVTLEFDPIFLNSPILPLFGSKLFNVSDE